jgi:hypothetical protein
MPQLAIGSSKRTSEFRSPGIDWDKVTAALDSKHQERWTPKRRMRSCSPYTKAAEVDLVLNRYRNKLYVFITAGGAGEALRFGARSGCGGAGRSF